IDEFKRVMIEENMKKPIKLTISGCLGVCIPNNVACLITPEKTIWLGLLNNKEVYDDLLNYLRKSKDEGKMLELPESLKKHQFERFQ
ncbi:MAG: (2Fe-2S) ferredoxin domain-containing protein, partial [Candidatus Heimdallarchaeota archaeon]|nr:(2Fe-2S) ferredoxin domain-containing protein [Candidatus Heimdallarchaeota archaeon]